MVDIIFLSVFPYCLWFQRRNLQTFNLIIAYSYCGISLFLRLFFFVFIYPISIRVYLGVDFLALCNLHSLTILNITVSSRTRQALLLTLLLSLFDLYGYGGSAPYWIPQVGKRGILTSDDSQCFFQYHLCYVEMKAHILTELFQHWWI
jgi:hypothetical protein